MSHLFRVFWDKAKEKAALAVNAELLDASWATGKYIVEYEQHGNNFLQRVISFIFLIEKSFKLNWIFFSKAL